MYSIKGVLARGSRQRGVSFVKGLKRVSKESASTCENQKCTERFDEEYDS